MGQKFDWVVIEDANKIERIKLNGADNSITSNSHALVRVFTFDGNTGELSLAGVNAPTPGATRIRLEPAGANIWLGGTSRTAACYSSAKRGTTKRSTMRPSISKAGTAR